MSTSGRFRISLDAGSLSWTPHGTVAGTLVLLVGERAFPDGSWQDYPVPVLGWWCRGCLRLLDGDQCVRLSLMDGPYSLEVRPAEGPWRLRMMRGDHPMAASPHEPLPELQAVTVEAADVLAGLTHACGALLDECERRSWTSSDVEEVRSAFEELRRRTGR